MLTVALSPFKSALGYICMAGSPGLVTQAQSPKREKSSLCSGCSLCNCRGKICFDLAESVSGLGEPWGWCVMGGSAHCSIAVGRVALAPAGQGALPGRGEQGGLVGGEKDLDTCVTCTAEIFTVSYEIFTLAEGAARGHSVSWQDVLILLTFQYVLKIANVSVFCKDLEPIFPFYF